MLFGGELVVERQTGQFFGSLKWADWQNLSKNLKKAKIWNNLMVTVLFSFFMGKLIFSFLALKPFCFGWMPHASLSICFWLQQFLETFTLNYSQTPEILPTPTCLLSMCLLMRSLPLQMFPQSCSVDAGSKLLHAKYNRVLFRRSIKHCLLAPVTKWVRLIPRPFLIITHWGWSWSDSKKQLDEWWCW